MRGIDVIWFRKGAGHPIRFFEIEHSTQVYSGLLRFNDVMIDFPIREAQAFIVGDSERTKAKFEREIFRRTFEVSGLRTSPASSSTSKSGRRGGSIKNSEKAARVGAEASRLTTEARLRVVRL
jgi:hypothetical protein